MEFEKFKSNYIDERNEPLFSFGYGLGRYTFKYSNLSISTNKIKFDESLLFLLIWQNTGQYDGKEVVQLYIRDLVGSVTRPKRVVKGFQKVVLKKGETQKRYQ
jgi:beta-glucosidase